MRFVLAVAMGLLAAPGAIAQTSAQDPPAAAGGVTATPITPEASGAHSAPGATTEASPAAPAPEVAAVGDQPADITQAVACATLSQQFGDTLTALTAPTAKTPLDEKVKTTSSEQAGAGRKACMAHDYATGLQGLRQALETLGKKPIV
ncbi:MAG: hypothetical protein WAS21_26360 [Geminicoccaceae bacterium]